VRAFGLRAAIGVPERARAGPAGASPACAASRW
jgi:hypothetical protein